MPKVLLLVLALGLEVVLVPHSHCDAGWLETADVIAKQVYYEERVRGILDGVVQWLEQDQSHKFAWAELWYAEVSILQKTTVQTLLRQGRLEFVGGGWVQMDESLTDLNMQIQNLAQGHRFLRDTFGLREVQVAWQIDSFGHSALTPALLTGFGYKYLVINRVDADFKRYLRSKAATEFLWETGPLGSSGSILTHVLSAHYELPLFLNPRSSEYCFLPGQEDKCAKRFLDLMALQGQSLRTVMFLYGGDFAFGKIGNATSPLFSALETLLRYFEETDKFQHFKVRIGSPMDYFGSLPRTRLFPRFNGELLPYVVYRNGSPQYWTGFFSTRPNLKRAVKRAMSVVRTAELLSALVLRKNFTVPELAEGFHHDAITGTSRRHVADLQGKHMQEAEELGLKEVKSVVSSMLNRSGIESSHQGRAFTFVNGLNWSRKLLLTLSVSQPFVEVRNSSDLAVESQSYFNSTDMRYTVYFQAVLPGLAAVTYFLIEHEEDCAQCAVPSIRLEGYRMSNGEYTLELESTGFISYIEHKHWGRMSFSRSEFRRYSSLTSGAYVFNPISQSEPFDSLSLQELSIMSGPVVSLAHSVWTIAPNVTFSQYIVMATRPIGYFTYDITTYALGNETMLEFEFLDPAVLPSFFTFSDGELRKWPFFEPVFSARTGKNFHPISSAVLIGNVSLSLSLFPDYPLGVGMTSKRSFSLHLHRSMSQDDGNGLETDCVDESIATHSFRVTLGPGTDQETWRHVLEQGSSVISLDMGTEWTHDTVAWLGFISPEVYLQSVTWNGAGFLATVINLRAYPVDLDIEGVALGKKVGLGGDEITRNPVFLASDVKLCFETCGNGSPVSIYRKRGSLQTGFLLPYEVSGVPMTITKELVRPVNWSKVVLLSPPTDLSEFTLGYIPHAPLVEPVLPEEIKVLAGRPYEFLKHTPTAPPRSPPKEIEKGYWMLGLVCVSSGLTILGICLLLYRQKTRSS